MDEQSCIYQLLFVGGSIPVSKEMPRFSMHQKTILERSFAVSPYPSKAALKELALQIELHEKQVKRWFERKRRAMKGEIKILGKTFILRVYSCIR